MQVNGDVVGSIGPGLHVLLGISRDDELTDADYIIKKILSLKLFSDANDTQNTWSKNVKEAGLEVLVVSQFTLYGNVKKGTKPDFSHAMKSENSKPMFEEFVVRLKKEWPKVQTGQFGSYMKIDLKLDGPVTLIVETPAKNTVQAGQKDIASSNKQ